MLRLQSIYKSFPGVKALQDVSITFNVGEVHALCGENGAGKSTLMHIISGNQQPDSGELYRNGQPVHFGGVLEAQKAGIGIVYQERSLAEALSVAENIFPVRPPKNRWGLISYRSLYAQTEALLASLGLGAISPKTLAGRLSPAAKQLVEVARVLAWQPSLLILDEPTASLTHKETEILFSIIRQRVHAGTGVIYISHRMAEIGEIADKVSVLKDGRYQGTFDARQTTAGALISKMVGRDLAESTYHAHVRTEPALEIENLSGKDFSNISFTLHKGEILGIAGLEGSGRTALARALFGDDPASAGTIKISGATIKPGHPADAIAAGIAYLTDDRRAEGLFTGRSVAENIVMAGLKGMFVNRKGNLATGKILSEKLNIKIRSVTQPVAQLSGGNQQKVVLAKWLNTHPDVLIINEPTHGVDVGAKAGIYEELKKLTAAGKSILLISSDLPELMLLSDRVLVMYNGRAQAILGRNELAENRIAALASGI